MNEYTITQIGEVAGFIPARIFNEGAFDETNIVWETNDGNDPEIFLYNGSETIQLTNNDVGDFEPAVSGNNVAWSRNDGNDAEIIFYNGNETIQLTDNEVETMIYKTGCLEYLVMMWFGYKLITLNLKNQ